MKTSNVDLSCRICGSNNETQEHIVNCTDVKEEGEDIDLTIIYGTVPLKNETVLEACKRIKQFNKLIDQENEQD